MERLININHFNGSSYDKILPDNTSLETKALYGLTGDNNINDILNILSISQRNMHRWKKYDYTPPSWEIAGSTSFGPASDYTFYYSQNIIFNNYGQIALDQPSSHTVPRYNENELKNFLNSIKRKFLKKGDNNFGSTTYYKDSTDCESYSNPHVSAIRGIPESVEGFIEYVYSININDYPEDGSQNLYYYRLCDNLEIEFGQYVGNGTYGESNKTSLTFNFLPKIVIVTQRSEGLRPYYAVNNEGWVRSFLWTYGQIGFINIGRSVGLQLQNHTLYWYSPENADYQLNSLNNEYKYIGIG